MTKEQTARVDKLKTYLRYAKTDNLEMIIVSVKDIEGVLELAIESQKEIENLKIANNEAWEEWNNLEQSSYEEKMKLKKEIILKNKQIDLMARSFRQDDVRNVEEIKEYFEKQAKEKGEKYDK